MISRAKVWMGVAQLCAVMLLIGHVSAQPVATENEEVRAEARALAKQGIEAMNEERYAAAVDLLRQAERMFHAPTHLLFIARCQSKLSQHVAAHEAYAAVLTEKVPNYAPAAFHQAREAAREEIAELHGKVARVRVTVRAAGGTPVRVYVDGEELALARLAYPIAIDAGEHRVEAHAPGTEPQVQTVTAALGATQDIAFVLAESTTSDAVQPPPPTPPEAEESFPVGATIAFAVGGAALVAGAITGGLTLSKSADIKDRCAGDVCPLEQQSAADDAKILGHTSTVMVIVGGVAAVAGIVLLAIELDDSGPATTALEVRVSPIGATLSGAF